MAQVNGSEVIVEVGLDDNGSEETVKEGLDDNGSKVIVEAGLDDSGSQVIVEEGLVDNGFQVIVEEGLDDDAWLYSVAERCLTTNWLSHKEHFIYRVNPLLRRENESAYEPLIISIGPYHRGKERLQAMEAHKRRYVCDLLSRNPDITFDDLMKLLKEKEKDVRECYPEDIHLKSNDLVEMLLLDGCFIIELFVKFESADDDIVNAPSWMSEFVIGHDLLLLENQLPFFILEEIFKFVLPSELGSSALVQYVVQLFDLMLGITGKKCGILVPTLIHHLLHLFHSRVLPCPSPTSPVLDKSIPCPTSSSSPVLDKSIPCPTSSSPVLEKSSVDFKLKLKRLLLPTLRARRSTPVPVESPPVFMAWMPNAAKLQEAGVKFKVGKGNLIDTHFFDHGVMEIPRILVDDITESRWRNIIAFEQCCLVLKKCYFSNYITFMDCLVNTSKDIEILHNNGILIHTLGNDEDVALLFNNLRKGVMTGYQDSYLRDTFKRVKDYSNSRMHRWRASLARDYFYSPWAILSFIAAIVILSLTIAQTVFSVLSYKPS